jgi:hypothetical protein
MHTWLFKSEPATWGWDKQAAKGEAGATVRPNCRSGFARVAAMFPLFRVTPESAWNPHG